METDKSTIKSIWSNDFYEKPPQPLWAFEIVFNDYTDIDSTEDRKTLQKAATNATLAERKINMVPTYFGGAMFMHPARSEHADQITIGFNENEDLDITAILQNLFNKTGMNQNWPEKSGGNTDNADMMYRTGKGQNVIKIKLIKPNENWEYGLDAPEAYTSKIFTFYNCQLMNISSVELDYSSDEVMKLTATFQFDYMKVTKSGSTDQTIGNDTSWWRMA